MLQKWLLNHFKVHITAKNCHRNVKNVVFSFLCIVVDRLDGGGEAIASLVTLPIARKMHPSFKKPT